MQMTFTLNGENISVDPANKDILLVDMLRDILGLTGTKRGCETGVCGMCSVLLNNKLIRACKTPVSKVIGHSVTTIEGITHKDGTLNDLQQAFLTHGAVQCGYCTPAMVLAGEALLHAIPHPTRAQIRQGLRSVLCRCTGYQQLVDAIEDTSLLRQSRG
jgi:carbon-monoxide dehydrogenase small subunit